MGVGWWVGGEIGCQIYIYRYSAPYICISLNISLMLMIGQETAVGVVGGWVGGEIGCQIFIDIDI